jgi:NADH-quinone oxidoreductase subunit L
MTAFYMFRLLYLVFLGRSRVEPDVEHHVHESPWSMTGVLVVLAIASAVGGFVAVPHFLEPMLPLPTVAEELHHFETPLIVVSVVIAVAGIGGALLVFGKGLDRAESLRERFAGLWQLMYNKYWIDELYESVLGRPLHWISDRIFLRVGDRLLIDGSLDGLAALARRSAGALGRLQTGNLHLYAFFVLLGLVAALAWSWRHG